VYHPCNVLEVSSSRWLISKVLISLFFYFLELVSQHLVSELWILGFCCSKQVIVEFRYKVFSTMFHKLKFLGCKA
jgi:hypothetical protein